MKFEGRTCSWCLLVLTCVTVFCVPAMLDRGDQRFPHSMTLHSGNRRDFDQSLIEDLRNVQPDFLFVGNSLLDSRLDREHLDEITHPRKSAFVVERGSGSAVWYIFLKHHIIPSGVNPKMTFIFFQDIVLTCPEKGLAPWMQEKCLNWLKGPDPVLDDVLAGVPGNWKEYADYYVRSLYPIQNRRGYVQKVLHDISRVGWDKYSRAENALTPDEVLLLQEEVNDLFSPGRLRQFAAEKVGAVEDKERFDFHENYPKSFLPHILRLARENDLPLCFVRMKMRPSGTNAGTELSRRLSEYSASLRECLEESGCPLLDFSSDSEIDVSWYSSGDYIGKDFRKRYTEKFVRKLPEVFQ